MGFTRRILVVEDEPLMASLLAAAITAAGFTVETASGVVEARESVRNFDPDAVLLDISLGDGPSGLDLANVLTKQRPDIALIVLTKYPDPRTAGVETTMLPSNCGFLQKSRVKDTGYLLESIEAALNDRTVEVRHDGDATHPLAPLSVKHLEVLRLMATGYTNDYIAKVKGASLSTVERWNMEIFRSLNINTKGNINSRVEAVRLFVTAAGVPDRL